MKNKNRSTMLWILIALIIIINIAILIFNYQTARNFSNIEPEKISEINYTVPSLNISNDPLSIRDFTRVSMNLTDKAIVLYSNCTALGLVTNEFQLYSIRQGIKKSIDIRPTVHDLTKSILENYNITVLMVKMTDVEDELYFSNIYLRKDNEVLSIDTKPSDAIALAVRSNSPIFIKNNVLEKYGEKTC